MSDKNDAKKRRLEDDPFRWPGYTGESHPEICDIRAMPAQPKTLKPGQLPEKLIRQYFEEGYLIIKDFFKDDELQACRDDLEDLVDDLAQKLYKAGKIENLYEEHDLDHRLVKLEEEWPGAVILLHKIGRLPPSFRALWGNERLLNLMEQLLGPDIAGMPNWNLRDKTPHNEATTVPWHQDAGYLSNDIYKVFMPTVWIPFVNTNKENGCMEVVPKGHLSGKVAVHQCCAGDTWYIMLEEEEMKKRLNCSTKDAVLCEIPYGGFLLFNNFIPHRSLDNTSDHVRWSVDLRFKVPGENNGMFGLKPDVIMRTKDNPNMKIDWDTFDSLNRTELQMKSVKDIVQLYGGFQCFLVEERIQLLCIYEETTDLPQVNWQTLSHNVRSKKIKNLIQLYKDRGCGSGKLRISIRMSRNIKEWKNPKVKVVHYPDKDRKRSRSFAR